MGEREGEVWGRGKVRVGQREGEGWDRGKVRGGGEGR